MNAHGRAVFITGCDSGLGFVAAKHLCNKGFHVFAGCLSKDSDGAKRLLEECPTPLCSLVPCDVSDYQQVLSARKQVEDELRRVRKIPDGGEVRLWGLMNVAGIGYLGNLEMQSWDDIKSQVNINLTGTMAICKAFLPLIRNAKGRIINFGCITGVSAMPFEMDAYAASKAGIVHLSNCLRVTMQDFGVKTSTIIPGTMPGTDLLRYNLAKKGQEWLSIAEDNVKEAYGEENFTRGGSKDNSEIAKAMNSKDWSKSDLPFEEFREAATHALLSYLPKQEYTFGNGSCIFPLLYSVLPRFVYSKVAPWFIFVLE